MARSMSSLRPQPLAVRPALADGWTRRRRDALAMLAVLIAAAWFLFAAGEPLPILLWDESRNIVNALEMERNGLGLVTTYGGAPDLWNTKPPLLIWLMAGSARLFGSAEWALRLPSMVATLGTLLVLMLFVRRATGSIATAALAAALLALSPALFGEHGARTADYDALLLFFVTSYLALGFFAIHSPRPGTARLVLIAAALLGAVLTKSVAGIAPAAGVALYLVLTRRLPRLWRVPSYAVAGGVVLGVVAAFVVAREAASPGYAAAAWHNDIAGRFNESIIGREKPADHYLRLLFAGYFAAPLLLLPAPLALSFAPPRARLLLVYAACVALGVLVTITAAASKLDHYLLPALPFLAIAAAITLRALLHRLVALLDSRRDAAPVAVALLAAAVLPLTLGIQNAAIRRIERPLHSDYEQQQALYGRLFSALSAPATVWVIEPGFALEDEPHYRPILRAHALVAAARGLDVRIRAGSGSAAAPRHALLATCDPATVPRLLALGPDVGGVPGCAAIAPASRGQSPLSSHALRR